MADITAARLNNLQARIALILGVGSGTSGYGQTVSSSQVNNTQVVDADHINNIYTDMVKARIHQVGVTETGIREVIEDLNTIAEETSQQVNNTGTTATDAEGTKKGIADYECFVDEPYVLMYGCMWVCFSVGAWLFLASKYEMPVSTTHSCVGAMIGMTLAMQKVIIMHKQNTKTVLMY